MAQKLDFFNAGFGYLTIGENWVIFGVSFRPPKMTQKMAKMAKKWPKMGQKWPFFDHFWVRYRDTLVEDLVVLWEYTPKMTVCEIYPKNDMFFDL